jgi:hypothetical protein
MQAFKKTRHTPRAPFCGVRLYLDNFILLATPESSFPERPIAKYNGRICPFLELTWVRFVKL